MKSQVDERGKESWHVEQISFNSADWYTVTIHEFMLMTILISATVLVPLITIYTITDHHRASTSEKALEGPDDKSNQIRGKEWWHFFKIKLTSNITIQRHIRNIIDEQLLTYFIKL